MLFGEGSRQSYHRKGSQPGPLGVIALLDTEQFPRAFVALLYRIKDIVLSMAVNGVPLLQ